MRPRASLRFLAPLLAGAFLSVPLSTTYPPNVKAIPSADRFTTSAIVAPALFSGYRFFWHGLKHLFHDISGRHQFTASSGERRKPLDENHQTAAAQENRRRRIENRSQNRALLGPAQPLTAESLSQATVRLATPTDLAQVHSLAAELYGALGYVQDYKPGDKLVLYPEYQNTPRTRTYVTVDRRGRVLGTISLTRDWPRGTSLERALAWWHGLFGAGLPFEKEFTPAHFKQKRDEHARLGGVWRFLSRPEYQNSLRLLSLILTSLLQDAEKENIEGAFFICNPVHTPIYRRAFGFELLGSNDETVLLDNRGGKSPPADLLYASREASGRLLRRGRGETSTHPSAETTPERRSAHVLAAQA
jgi:hypothetical protein